MVVINTSRTVPTCSSFRSLTWLTFDPKGMSFDEYFDLNNKQSRLEQLAAFGVGLAPAFLQQAYFDLKKLSVREERGPCSGLACQLCAGVAAAESLKILLRRGAVRCAPYYSQFDAYRGVLRSRRLWRANRHPWQLLKRRYLVRKFSLDRISTDAKAENVQREDSLVAATP